MNSHHILKNSIANLLLTLLFQLANLLNRAHHLFAKHTNNFKPNIYAVRSIYTTHLFGLLGPDMNGCVQ